MPLEPLNCNQNQPLPVSGALLGIDFGTVRVGLAVSDERQKVAIPLTTYHRQEKRLDAQYFLGLILRQHIVGLVVGLPVHMSGAEGGKAKQARSFGVWLGQVANRPVHFVDERYTSVEAWNYLKEGGLKASQRRKHVDKIAAQILLQSYLDAQNAQQRSGISSLNTNSPNES